MGVVLLVLSAGIFIYWRAGVNSPIYVKPPVFRTRLGPALILLVAIILGFFGLILI
jgi:hypothetical protein